MTYSFECPFPCNYEIRVDAINNEDAVIKLITAGAIRCRNIKYRCHCEKAQHDMLPISDEKLKQIVRTCMRGEHEKQEDYNGILASLHG